MPINHTAADRKRNAHSLPESWHSLAELVLMLLHQQSIGRDVTTVTAAAAAATGTYSCGQDVFAPGSRLAIGLYQR